VIKSGWKNSGREKKLEVGKWKGGERRGRGGEGRGGEGGKGRKGKEGDRLEEGQETALWQETAPGRKFQRRQTLESYIDRES
jgi:hypothetical protein